MQINIDVPVEQVYVDLERVISMLLTAETVAAALVTAVVIGLSNIIIKHTFSYRYQRDEQILLLEAENKRLADLLYSSSDSVE